MKALILAARFREKIKTIDGYHSQTYGRSKWGTASGQRTE